MKFNRFQHLHCQHCFGEAPEPASTTDPGETLEDPSNPPPPQTTTEEQE